MNVSQPPFSDRSHRLVADAPLPSSPAVEPVAIGDLGVLVRQVIRMVRAHWWAGALAAALILGAAVAYELTHVHNRTAEVTLLIESPLGEILNAKATPTHPDFYENVLRNHLSVMESRGFRRYLAAHLSTAEVEQVSRPYLKAGESATAKSLDDILEHAIRVERNQGRELFTVVVKHRDPAVALLLADRFSTLYLVYRQEEFLKASATANATLQATANELTQQIRALEDRRRAFRQEHQLIGSSSIQNVMSERIARANAALSSAHLETARLEVQLRRARADLAASPTPFDNASLARFGNTPELRVKIEQARADLRVLAEDYGPNHPRMIEATSQVTQLERALNDNFRLALADLESQFATAEATERRIEAELKSAFEQSLGADRLESEMTALGNEIAAKQTAVADVAQRLERAKVGAELQTDVMHVVDAAYLKRTLVSPRAAILGVSFLFALGAFFFVPWVLHVFNRRVTGDADVAALFGREVLGAIPHLRDVAKGARGEIVLSNQMHYYVETFMTIVGQLSLRLAAKPGMRLLVTSTVSGEGKSMVASNVAAAFARIGRRTVIVDLDLRRPAHHERNRDTTGGTVMSWLRKQPGTLDSASAPVPGLQQLADDLFLLPAGTEEVQPTNWLMSPRLDELLNQLSQRFDVVVIDTPPAGVFHDAIMLASRADATLFVVRHNFALTEQTRKILADFDSTPAPVVGTVFNGLLPRHTQSGLTRRQLERNYRQYYDLDRTKAVTSAKTSLAKRDAVITEV